MKEKTNMRVGPSLNRKLGDLRKELRVSSRDNVISELIRHSKEYLKLRKTADYNQLINEDFTLANQFSNDLKEISRLIKKGQKNWNSDINTLALRIQARLEALEKK